MRRPDAGIWLTVILGLASPALSAAGLSTRDLNPITQGIYLPSVTSINGAEGWQVEHNLWLTNSLQTESRSGESLLIDVENFRYQLGLEYRFHPWVLRIDLPLVSNAAGGLDELIEDWHDFFGFPQGNRESYADDRLAIEYRRNGEVEYAQNSRSSGLGDIAVALGYSWNPGFAGYLGIELPSGSVDDYSGNEAIDAAVWLIGERDLGEARRLYGLIGASFPGDGELLDGLTADWIPLLQAGIEQRFGGSYVATAQLDTHGSWLKESRLKAFGESLQLQVGLGFDNLVPGQRLDLFFSEDISVGSAPDISFGLRLQTLPP